MPGSSCGSVVVGHTPAHVPSMIIPDCSSSPAAVAFHYDELDIAYRRIWGEHVHHGYWETGRESPSEATDALVHLVAGRLSPKPGQTLCDIGCGYGATAAYFVKHHGVQVTGFTLSSAQAKLAQARGLADFTCLERDFFENGMADASFDHAYAIESSEHMADKGGFFTEVSRVLRPGGRLVVCAWLEGENLRQWQVQHLLEKICSEGQLPSMGSRADYEALAAAAGFKACSYLDISSKVRRTWSICMYRFAGKLLTDRAIRKLASSSATRNRSFMFSLPRLIVALHTGAMRYGVFAWEKPSR